MKGFILFLTCVACLLAAVIGSLVSAPATPALRTVGGTPTCEEICEDTRDAAIIQADIDFAHAEDKALEQYASTVEAILAITDDCINECAQIPSPCMDKCLGDRDRQLLVAARVRDNAINAAQNAYLAQLDVIDAAYAACLAACP